ncbi:hypothetical protein OHA25_41980 [Nonomuraea sp. NBC_00507]|uniref:hypothetical protein n=1 Tax=Nonomuraea sp. NBC_00507 TaxID=2976002 RepID=UPI002E18EB0E
MLSQLTPSPAPTVTVTETVVVAPAPPVVNVQMPPDTLDVWKDIVWGDFGGAVLAVLGGLVAGWLASRLVVRADRRARDEDNRRTLALEYADASRQLAKLLYPGVQSNILEDALERFELITGRIARFYSEHREHERYASWIKLSASPIGTRLYLAMQDTETAYGPTSDPDKLAELSELRTDLKVIEHSTLEWVRSPENWKLDESAREAHTRVKEMFSSSPAEDPPSE